jgi:type VI secretion system protein ImpI
MNSSWVFKIQSNCLLPPSACDWIVPLHGGVIGRAIDCDWVLADASRVISRQHARIDLENGQCYWSDLGTNSTQVNGRPMSPSQRTLLMPGDILKLGDYSIVLEKIQQGHWQQHEPDPLDFLLSPAAQSIHIDELLRDTDQCPVAGPSSDPGEVPVLAQRMYVGSRQQAPETLAVPTEYSDLENELATVKQLLRICVQGYMQLLQARRLYKTELGGDYTSLSGKGNNPLKFSKTVDDAMALLTGGLSPGYLPADQALEQAREDLLAHMQLSIAQVQQVMGQIQTELNPELISEVLAHEGGFNLKIASSRKARLWDLYCERYQKLGELWS